MNKNQVLKELEKIDSDFQAELKEQRERYSRLRELVYNIPDIERKYKNNDFSPEEAKLIDEFQDLIFYQFFTWEHKQEKLRELDKKIHDDAMKEELKKTRETAINPLSLMFDGKITQALGKIRTNGKYNAMAGSIEFDGINLFSTESILKAGVGTAKIFRYAVAEFTKRNAQNTSRDKLKCRFFLDVEDFASANGVDITSDDDMKNFRRKLNQSLKTLLTLNVTCTEKVKGKQQSYAGLNYLGSYELKVKTLEIEFTNKMAEYLASLPLLQYPRSLYRLPDREFNAFAIGEAMCLHYSQDNNVIKGTENKISVEALLKYTSFPTLEKLKEHKWSWEEKVKEPLERALDILYQCGFLKDYSFCYEGGIEISDETMRAGAIDSYKKFISLIVKFELNDFEEHGVRAIGIAEKKAAQIDKMKSSRKKKKNTDNNTTNK